jgi:hypothetical protein
MFCLLGHTAGSSAVTSPTKPETRPKNDLGEPGHPVDAVDGALGVHLAFQERYAGGSRGSAQGEQEASLDRGEQQVLGTPRISRPVELTGRGRGELGQSVGGEDGMAARFAGKPNRVVVR